MAIIHELSAHMADLIAAGEVVERPASVAKELIENAIDAQAKHITLEMENGGVSYLRITDDGCGMSAEDAPVAFRRHATSKLQTEKDLMAICTLGFRGEALAAIASVSKIDLLTKQQGTLAGTHLHLKAGQILENEDAGCPDGTTIIIRDIFFNTPARMKFLKKDFTEAGYILSVVQHAALSHPEIAFTCIRDGKKVFSTAGDNCLMTPVFSVFGKELASVMIEVPKLERAALCTWGYIVKAHSPKPNRNMQHFFVNGRYIKNRTMQAALEEAYRNKIITGKYPCCVLFLTLPLNAVDVNVHPAKTEIKFSDEKAVFDILYIACKNALEQDGNIPEIIVKPIDVKQLNLTENQQQIAAPEKLQDKVLDTFSKKKPLLPLVECDDFNDLPVEPLSLHQATTITQTPVYPGYGIDSSLSENMDRTTCNTPAQSEKEFSKKEEPIVQETLSPSVPASFAHVIGQAFKTYIVAEDEKGLLLIDKHAAHERMIFNALQGSTQIPQQELLTPAIIELSPAEAASIYENLEKVCATGFDLTAFGGNSFAVRSMPAYLEQADLPSVLSEIVERLVQGKDAESESLDDLIHTVSCKAAIKAGGQTSIQEMQSICDRVLSDPEVRCCPHGRPVMVRLTKYEIDKLFKRVNQ